LISFLTFKPKSSRATVYFDIEKYGDKELKIATIGKLKQNLRNFMGNDPSLIPGFFKLALYDGLDYDLQTDAGGLDGLFDIKDELANKALDAVLTIKKSLQRTNELSLADIIAYSGAAAIETVGGPRITVQLGRTDQRSGQPKEPYPMESVTAETFKKAGLGAREGCLLLVTLGELECLADKAIAQSKSAENGDDDYGIDGPDGSASIPDTFGSSSEIYGSLVGKEKFGGNFLDALVKGKEVTPLGKAILADDQLKAFALKYAAGNKSTFLKDVSDAYSKFTLLGSQFTNRNS